MDINELKELIDFLRENGVSEYESNENGKHIKLHLADFDEINKEPFVKPTAPKTLKGSIEETARQEEKVDNNELEGVTLIKSPIVGTFYGKPAPDAKPFVVIGDKVHKGQVLCIIEAMKVMNEIESTCDGVVEEICVKDSEIVEFSQVLFKIK